MKDPVDAIFVVGSCEDMADHQLSCPCHCARIVTEVRMLEQDAAILLMDANRVLDGLGFPSLVDESSIHVVYCTFAVASQCQRVGHVAASIFSEIKGMLT
jgi:hypothetical protein